METGIRLQGFRLTASVSRISSLSERPNSAVELGEQAHNTVLEICSEPGVPFAILVLSGRLPPVASRWHETGYEISSIAAIWIGLQARAVTLRPILHRTLSLIGMGFAQS